MHLSEESRYKRMMGACREPSPELIDRFVHVDRHGSMAFVAVAGQDDTQTIIGAARYAPHPSAKKPNLQLPSPMSGSPAASVPRFCKR